MQRLPYDVQANIITSLPFEDVRAVCNTNQDTRNFCLANSKPHRLIWQNIIQKTFGSIPNYHTVLEQLSRKYCQNKGQINRAGQNDDCPDNIFESSLIYNYLIYVNFIHRLDQGNQAYIYYRQQDYDSINQLIEKVGIDKLLIEVAKNGHLDVVKYLVGKGANIRIRNESALQLATRYGHLNVVKYLIDQGANIHSGDDYALRDAAYYGHLDVVKYLVEKGADIHVEDDYAFRIAAKNGHLDMVKYMIERGANIHAGEEGALRLAAYYGHLDMVKYLIEQGANIHAKNDYALRRAVENGHSEVVKYLKSLM